MFFGLNNFLTKIKSEQIDTMADHDDGFIQLCIYHCIICTIIAYHCIYHYLFQLFVPAVEVNLKI